MQSENKQAVIPLSKKKTIRSLAGAILFVILGVLFILKPFWFIKSDDPMMIRTIGYLCIAFFGIAAVFLVRTLTNKKDGFFIDAEGIIDRSSGVAVGRVYWKDITGMRVEQVASQPFIMLEVKDPLSYIQQQHNPLKKRTMEMNYQIYKTPIGITANFLDIEFAKLEDLIRSGLKTATVK